MRQGVRKVDSVIQRIENVNVVMERQAMAKMSIKLYPRSLLESMDNRIEQFLLERAVKVCSWKPHDSNPSIAAFCNLDTLNLLGHTL